MAQLESEREFAEPHVHHHVRMTDGPRRLTLVLIITSVYLVAEAVGGVLSGSLTLLADAGHMLTDVAALGLALLAVWFSSRPATSRKTFGYYRIEIVAALVNGVALVLISFLILYEAYARWSSPPVVRSNVVILIASGGLIVNLLCAKILHGRHQIDLNLRGAWLHVISDALGSMATIIAGILMSLYGWYLADPLVSSLVAFQIIWSAWILIRESTNVLLEGTPSHINLAAVESAILETSGVSDVHDLHIWTITSGRDALSAHVIHSQTVSPPELLRDLRVTLNEKFGVDHVTIQMELPESDDETFHFCHAGTACFQSKRV